MENIFDFRDEEEETRAMIDNSAGRFLYHKTQLALNFLKIVDPNILDEALRRYDDLYAAEELDRSELNNIEREIEVHQESTGTKPHNLAELVSITERLLEDLKPINEEEAFYSLCGGTYSECLRKIAQITYEISNDQIRSRLNPN